ncbi:MAG: hypothetical protein B7X35_07725 [Halothiobacillus sp. 14-56-357]|jgi:putative endonuclease|nr:MAG: hypothetical protein B7X44_10660 [Halothiobacillus sp. 15-55-196]OZB55942.1 MAG: hypothetical protein B7X35_07725 [Halothiobacillus sp. 14-56-357]OZB78469.1 MAG: hypothetical protein B7X29_04765 [Halothiobacillus sp. 13-55-115]
MKSPAVYMLASQRNGTLYIGVTSNLIQRVWQHREGLAEGFTKQYDVKTLVWYEQHETMESAIGREKAMKKWLRKWKLATIEKTNPDWRDLWPEILGTETSTNIPAIIPAPQTVIPTQAGIQKNENAVVSKPLDSRLRGNDEEEGLL